MERMIRVYPSVIYENSDDLVFCTKSDGFAKGSSFFIKNGSKLLEELIIQWGGRSKIPLRNYSSKEIVETTHNFSSHGLVTEDSCYKIYKGSFDKHKILVKKYYSNGFADQHMESFVVRDIVISSQMSFHKNVLKLIGYCLDYEYPALVYKRPETCESLEDHLLNTKLTWESKLSLASDIAYVLAYLHTGFQTPVLYRNMKLEHFVIDKHGTARFVDFSFCVSIPLGESQVENALLATKMIIDVKFFTTGVLTEKTDVFNFGLVLIELLTQRRILPLVYDRDLLPDLYGVRSYVTMDEVKGIVNGDMVIEGEVGRDKEIRVVAALALKCIGDEKDTPEMVDIAKELKRMHRSARSSSTS